MFATAAKPHILLIAEPILQWSLGTPADQTGQKGVNCATKILMAQSPCALDVVLISPVVDSGRNSVSHTVDN